MRGLFRCNAFSQGRRPLRGETVSRSSVSEPSWNTQRSHALLGMERRFQRDSNLQHLYIDFMKQYQDMKHMSMVEEVDGNDEEPKCYLPHHGVLRESSITTKLRVVFNGS